MAASKPAATVLLHDMVIAMILLSAACAQARRTPRLTAPIPLDLPPLPTRRLLAALDDEADVPFSAQSLKSLLDGVDAAGLEGVHVGTAEDLDLLPDMGLDIQV
jgi:hypothetical protein